MNRRHFLAQLIGLTALSTNHYTLTTIGAAANANTLIMALSYLASPTELSNVLHVDATVPSDPAAKMFATITEALATCTFGETILIAPGTYTESITIAVDGIMLQGSGQPYYDSVSGRLVAGTIVRGRINTGKVAGLTIRDLGVDLYGVDSRDCIGASNTDAYLHRHFENLTLLGNGASALAHGLYSVGHDATLSNIKVYYCYHGIAVHGALQNLSDIYCYACYGTSIVIKAKNVFDVYQVNVNNVIMEGATASGSYESGPLQCQTANSSNLYDINITNVAARYCNAGVFQVFLGDGTGTINNISVTNCTSYGNRDFPLTGDYRIKDVTGLVLTNCRSYGRVSGYGFQVTAGGTATDIFLYSCFADMTGSGMYFGDFDVLELNGEHWPQTATATSTNTPSPTSTNTPSPTSMNPTDIYLPAIHS
jgi:hypothetical protein